MMFRSSVLWLLVCSVTASAEWLDFNAGAPENTAPLVQHNDVWDDFLSFDVELRGLLADTIEADSISYLRFNYTPGTVTADSVGLPELPVVRCFVWVPDSTDLSLQYALNCMESISCIPVYPRPLDSLRADSVDCPCIDEFFRKDSSAYASDEWYPDILVRLVDEFHLRDTRIAVVDVCPVQYLADGDSLRVFSDIEITIWFDDTTEVWTTRDLGPYEDMVGERILGYRPEDTEYAPSSGSVSRPRNLVSGPATIPDYVILVAEGLDGNWIDTLAHHRADLCGFDVAIVRTDSVLSQFSESSVLTPTIIRDFTETMWDWGQPSSTKRPSYLLLIGDHEDSDSSSAGWFLPTKVYEVSNSIWTGENSIGDDDWYVYLDEPYTNLLSYPDMMVGRLPVRRVSTLQDMIDVIRAYEAPSSLPAPDSLSWRRYMTMLTEEEGRQWGEDGQAPDSAWTDSLRQWCGYSWDYVYGGDFDASTYGDGSTMTSIGWDTLLTEYFTRGQQIAFYIDHGLPHCFSAGMDYTPGAPFEFQGIPDSVFNCFDVDSLSYEEVAHHGYPFIINACCATGRFNHTLEEHTNSDTLWFFCRNDNQAAGPLFDFRVDCIGEKFIKNTDMGAIGFFGASASTMCGHYLEEISGIMESIYGYGITRLGDAISSMRFIYMDDRFKNHNIALFNLLGDPGVDIGDRVKFRSCSDLIVAPSDLDVSRYPTIAYGESTTASLHVAIRNAGADSSGSFDADLRIQVSAINHDTTLTETFPSIAPGQETTLTFDGWDVPSGLTSSMNIRLTCTADDNENLTESWTGNNEATRIINIMDFYPNDEGWPIRLPGSIKSPPALADLDDDGDLDIVVVVGTSLIMAIDPDDPDDPLWISAYYIINPTWPNTGIGYSVPVAGDITGDGDPEVVVDTIDRLIVLDGEDGDLMCSFYHDTLGKEWTWGPHSPVLADIFTEGGGMIPRDEIACVCADSLFILRYEGGDLNKLDSIAVVSGYDEVRYAWLAAAELDGNSGDDLTLIMNAGNTGTMHTVLNLYSSDSTGEFYDSRTWSSEVLYSIQAVGDLGSGDLIAISRGMSNSQSPNPVDLLDPSDLTTAASCSTSSTTSSNNILCCLMGDWVFGSGADRVIAPAENQCFVFTGIGLEDWYGIYSDTSGVYKPPFPALGDLDDDGIDDLLIGIRNGFMTAYDDEGDELSSLEFPFHLPSEVYGGFLIADIDNDTKVEVVFGTMDNYLHVWEFDYCDSSYAPWPQIQHDAMRTGVLE